MNNKDNYNFLITMVLSLSIVFGWSYFFEKKPTSPATSTQKSETSLTVTPSEDSLAIKAHLQTALSREEAIAKDKRIPIRTDKLTGSIRLIGARLDDLTLAQYHETTDPSSAKVTLLNPENARAGYYVDLGWLSIGSTIKTPDDQTLWSTQDHELTINKPLTLTWDNGEGVVFTRKISIDENYMFRIENTVSNNTQTNLQLQHFTLTRRHGRPQTSDYMALHEGVVAYLEDKLQEVKYADLQDKGRYEFQSQKGWFGFTDKYWLTAVLPTQGRQSVVHFRHVQQNDEPRFQVDSLSPQTTVQPSGSFTEVVSIFSGPKELKLLDSYETKLNVEHFDLAVDFGWFYFITKPLFYFLSSLQKWLGNLGVAILALTVILKLLFFPLANKSYRSMARMKQMQPMMESLKERFGDDKIRFNQEMMALYKKEKVNPASGCVPMIIQIPFFFALYKVLFISIEMRHAPFWGWIQDLSAPDPTTVFNLFGLIPWDPPSFLMIGVWPLIMGVTMFVQQKLNPPPADPMQAKMFLVMPFMFTYMLAQFPVGLVIYWAWNNVLTIAQQWAIMRQNQSQAQKA